MATDRVTELEKEYDDYMGNKLDMYDASWMLEDALLEVPPELLQYLPTAVQDNIRTGDKSYVRRADHDDIVAAAKEERAAELAKRNDPDARGFGDTWDPEHTLSPAPKGSTKQHELMHRGSRSVQGPRPKRKALSSGIIDIDPIHEEHLYIAATQDPDLLDTYRKQSGLANIPDWLFDTYLQTITDKYSKLPDLEESGREGTPRSTYQYRREQIPTKYLMPGSDYPYNENALGAVGYYDEEIDEIVYPLEEQIEDDRGYIDDERGYMGLSNGGRIGELEKEYEELPFDIKQQLKADLQRLYTPQELQADDYVLHDRGFFNYSYDPDNTLEDTPSTQEQYKREFQQLRNAIPDLSTTQQELGINPLQELMGSGALSEMGKYMLTEMSYFSQKHGQLPDSLREIETDAIELELSDGGRIGEIEQELMDLEYQQEQEHFERVKDEPGLQEFSLAAPAAKVGILSQALKTGASKLFEPLLNMFSKTPAAAGLPSIMARGSGKGFERFGKRRGATTSRVNQNLDELISDFFAQSKGGTDLSNVSPYTLELIQANMPAIRAAAARQKQNPKAGLNRLIELIDELE